MSDFVLEIGFEEMPARFLPALTDELKNRLAEGLEREMLSCKSLDTYSTPRRLCAYAADMTTEQKSRQELVVGPPASIAFDQDNNMTKAGLGFARSQKVAQDQLFRHQTEKGEYLAIKKNHRRYACFCCAA